mmetsp:Transcript_17439/g.29919  ORF Transcript_17439/g.29919 Transcript_17439/m.29919 type:complete len:296 (-) Transcript_17439:187-1074(-)|eukprot:CAMPEP_0119116532 /NCGR_PEP_ID=MMETSP1180-20130426/52338_1 /TAXON_ID=3052 ORGANISM="Chlamydomonas cf sp, Strain CCMP681" /NCGR_SAMPLE_ID=MMETSP1180 /ASSEMBLY_ACC=CAM_ASM_000741 /LENGTH=295 /DNA_ID=CAMNT_0007105693 /DNA_START=44 /DNA_END=931 /DNA_ORIENTATION=+
MAGTDPQAKRRKDDGEEEVLALDQVKSALSVKGPHHTEDVLLECAGGQYVAVDKNTLFRATGSELLQVLLMGTEVQEGGGSNSSADQVPRRTITLGGKRYPVVPLLDNSAHDWMLVMRTLYDTPSKPGWEDQADYLRLLAVAHKHALQRVLEHINATLRDIPRHHPSKVIFAASLASRFDLGCSASLKETMSLSVSAIGEFTEPHDFHSENDFDHQVRSHACASEYLQALVTGALQSPPGVLESSVLLDLLQYASDALLRFRPPVCVKCDEYYMRKNEQDERFGFEPCVCSRCDE